MADLREVPKHKDNVFVLKQVDRKKFVETLVEGLEKLDKEV